MTDGQKCAKQHTPNFWNGSKSRCSTHNRPWCLKINAGAFVSSYTKQ